MTTRSSDIAVLGGGIIGVAAAWALARRGARVRLIEARRLGRGATQASAGMLAPYTEAHLDTPLHQICVEALTGYDEVVARVRADSGAAFEYARTGTIEVALDESGATHLRQQAALLTSRGVPCAWSDLAGTQAQEPAVSPAARGGLLVPAQGFVAVTPFLQALAAAAQRHGVMFEEATTVERVEVRAQGFDIHTSSETFAAGRIVASCGCWTSMLAVAGEPALPVPPVRGQLIELEARDHPISRVVWGPRCYLVPWASGRVLVGATVEHVGFDERATSEGVASLLGAAIELVPALASATFVEARVGLRPGSSDGLPVVGESTDLPGLFHATAHYRNGVLLAPLTADILADLMLEGRRHPALDALSPGRLRGASARP